MYEIGVEVLEGEQNRLSQKNQTKSEEGYSDISIKSTVRLGV